MQPNQLLTVPPQRELRRRLHPQPVPPKREGSWWSYHCPQGQHGGDCQSDHLDEGVERHSSSHRSARRFFEARTGCAASSHILWQLWLCNFVRSTYSLPRALHTVSGKKTTARPSVRVVNPCRKARPAEPTRTCTAMTAASRKHQSLRLLREYHLLSQRSISSMRKPNGRSMPQHESVTTSPTSDEALDLVAGPSQPDGAHPADGPNFRQRRLVFASMSGGSSSDWWDDWEWRGRWKDSSSPDHTLTEQAPDEQASILLGSPTHIEFRLIPEHFRTLVLERLRLPLSVVEARCESGLLLDTLGRHRAACPRSGRLRRRAVAPERTLAMVCREAGATVRCNGKLMEMNVAVASTDEREIEVLASGLPLHHGAQLAVDITLRSTLTRCGNACDQADRVNGIVASRARRDEENKCAELLQGDRCCSVVVGMETGGGWSTEALQCVEMLATVRAREAPRVLRRSALLAWTRRWSRMLSVSCGRAFANSLVSPSVDLQGTDGPPPDLADLFRSEEGKGQFVCSGRPE